MDVDKALNKILDFAEKELDQHSKKIAEQHRAQFASGLNRMGKPFKAYSKEYARKKAAGKAAKNQLSKQTNPVNLVLTGKLFDEFEHIKSHKGAEIGFDYGIDDAKLGQRLHDFAKGRYGKKNIPSKKRIVASDQRLGPKVEIALVKMFVEQIVNNLNRLARRAKTVVNM